MKKTLLLLALLIATSIHAQEKMTSTKGIITFEASVPFFENVEAKNETVNSYLNTKKGQVTFVVYINMFHFQRSLMEEHFNANYLESKKYPKATFKGVIEKFEIKNIDFNEKIYYISGKINIHGKSKNIRVSAKIKKADKGIEIQSNFTLNTDDFNIDIPYIVRNKISKKVTVTVYSVLQ
tara:strand:- start:9015 stop:9554 length:540 start_codon:yes stop_codon:yes gene_type:complete